MTDLSKGIVEINGYEINANTTKNEVLTFFADNIAPMSSANFLYLDKKFCVNDAMFICTLHFSDEGQLVHLELFPCIEYKSTKGDRTGRQEERRQFCDKWLYDRLGEPDRNLGGAEYVYEHIRVSCVTHFDQHNGADAGYIVVNYLR